MNALGIEIREAERRQRLAREAEAFEANRRAQGLDEAHGALDEVGAIIEAQGRAIAGLKVAAACGWTAALVGALALVANF